MPSVKKKGASWILIIFTYIIFFPVSLVLIYKKLAIDDSSDLKSSTKYSIFGWIFTVIFLIMFLSSLGIDDSVGGKIEVIIFFAVITGIPGILAILKARKIKVRYNRYQKYMEIIGDNYITPIDNITQSIQVSFDEAKKDLNTMIEQGYLGDGYLDLNKHQLVIPYLGDYKNETTVKVEFVNNFMEQERQPVTKVITCKNCGANNTITTGIASECDFCGSPIA
jgi:hypothetical protein